MKLFKGLLVAALLLTGCAAPAGNESEGEEPKNPVAEPIKVLAPTGAPALSVMELAADGVNTVDFVTGSEALSAEFAKSDSDYDMILAPINLGAKLISADKTVYRLEAVITWGNLYLVGTSDTALEEAGNFAAFGEGSVPDIVFKNSVDVESLVPEITYYSSAQDVQGILLSGKAESGLLAEPAVTATIAKAKEQGIELKVILDLQSAYQEKMSTTSTGFPQAAIFVKQGSEEKVSAALSQIESFVNEAADEPSKVSSLVDQLTPEVLGVPSSKIAAATWAKQNIRYTPASSCEADITTMLKLFGIDYTSEMLSK